MNDIEIECVSCQVYFLWTAGEQKFLQKLVDEGKFKELNQPKRCGDCRAKKKAGNTNNNNNFH